VRGHSGRGLGTGHATFKAPHWALASPRLPAAGSGPAGIGGT